jgi:hypothetical protein
MSGRINYAPCVAGGVADLGTKFCVKDNYNQFRGLIVAQKGQSFTAAEVETIEASLKKAQYYTDGRIVYIPLAGVSSDDTQAATETTTVDGAIHGRQDNAPSFTAQLKTKSIYLTKQLLKLNGQELVIYFITDTSLMLGKALEDGSFTGKSGTLYTDTYRPVADNSTRIGTVKIVVDDAAEFGAWLDYIEIDNTILSELAMINEVKLTATKGAGLSTTINVASLADNHINIGSIEPELATPEAWIVVNLATGVLIPSDELTFTLLPGGNVQIVSTTAYPNVSISLATPETLIENGIGSINGGTYEGMPVKTGFSA